MSEENIEKKNDYYFIKSKNLAITVSYLLNRDFYQYDDRYANGEKIYSFIDDKEFRRILTLVNKMRKSNN